MIVHTKYNTHGLVDMVKSESLIGELRKTSYKTHWSFCKIKGGCDAMVRTWCLVMAAAGRASSSPALCKFADNIFFSPPNIGILIRYCILR